MIQGIAHQRQRGQAFVEYALALFILVTIFFVIDYQTKKSIGKLWKSMAKQIAAGCPLCDPPDVLK